ncbi:single-strand binding protein [Cnuella takakiae]|uniref:Single-stranded DNA-binding protein n=1 Tax=Cnuella takakiae TaxID=1302690 RepID=A0A1M5I912_9BACT|nr:single-stranded DNA-binding protein [Cnuella takakiae]OLY93208.1 single-stranded DNA-binding protein [Cnuella takakiae]SHG24283.1 single-strand binding protein [Cnuella takakiae]
MIKMQVIGRLGKDCMVNTVNGKNVINFTVAHSEKYKDSQGNNQERTTWVDCAYWTDRTAVAPYLTKGTQVYVEGAPEVRTFTRNDGTSGATLTMRVRDVQLLGGRDSNSVGGGGSNNYGQQDNGNQGGYNNNRNEAPASSGIGEPVDDLPF